MIPKIEILSKSKEWGIPLSTTEKDYVIGWVLAGINHFPKLSENFIFKGGTCLKKCFFNQYRFSEDLDFTVLDPALLDEKWLIEQFIKLADFLEEESGIRISKQTIRFESYINLNGKTSLQGKLNYQGPLQPRTNFPRLKLDLLAEEILVCHPEKREIHHDYSDLLPITTCTCYGIEELFAEKLRALVERARPRDLYDIVHLHHKIKTDPKLLLKTLKKKCQFKGTSLPSLQVMKNHPNLKPLESEWEQMLKHQLPHLEPFSHYWNQLSDILKDYQE